MQVSSVSNIGRTNFGLEIDPSIRNMLSDTQAVIEKRGKDEREQWRKSVNSLKLSAPADYILFVQKFKDKKLSTVWLQFPEGDQISVYELGENDILDTNTIKHIKKQIKDKVKVDKMA